MIYIARHTTYLVKLQFFSILFFRTPICMSLFSLCMRGSFHNSGNENRRSPLTLEETDLFGHSVQKIKFKLVNGSDTLLDILFDPAHNGTHVWLLILLLKNLSRAKIPLLKCLLIMDAHLFTRGQMMKIRSWSHCGWRIIMNCIVLMTWKLRRSAPVFQRKMDEYLVLWKP